MSFRNITYEDALTILSYGSPYDVELELQKARQVAKPSPETTTKKDGLCSHPMFRSRSTNDLGSLNPDTIARRMRNSGILAKHPVQLKTEKLRAQEADQVQSSASTRSLNEKFLVHAAEGENGKIGKITVHDIAISKDKRSTPDTSERGKVAVTLLTKDDPIAIVATEKRDEDISNDNVKQKDTKSKTKSDEGKTTAMKNVTKEEKSHKHGKEKGEKEKSKKAKKKDKKQREKPDESSDLQRRVKDKSKSSSSSSSSSDSDSDGKQEEDKEKAKQMKKKNREIDSKEKEKKSKTKVKKGKEETGDIIESVKKETSTVTKESTKLEKNSEPLPMAANTNISSCEITPDLLKEAITENVPDADGSLHPKPPRRTSQQMGNQKDIEPPPPLPSSPPPQLDEKEEKDITVVSQTTIQLSPGKPPVETLESSSHKAIYVKSSVQEKSATSAPARVKRASSVEDLQESDPEAASPAYKRPKSMSTGDIDLGDIKLSVQHPTPMKRKKRKAPHPPSAVTTQKGYNFKETFQHLSDKDRADMIKISYEEFGAGKSRSDPSLSPGREKKEEVAWNSLERSHSAERVISPKANLDFTFTGSLKADLDESVTSLDKVDDPMGVHKGKYDSQRKTDNSSSDTESDMVLTEPTRNDQDTRHVETSTFTCTTVTTDGRKAITTEHSRQVVEKNVVIKQVGSAFSRSRSISTSSSSSSCSPSSSPVANKRENIEEQAFVTDRKGVSFATGTKEETTTASEAESDVDGKMHQVIHQNVISQEYVVNEEKVLSDRTSVVEAPFIKETVKRERPIVDDEVRKEQRRRRLLQIVADAHEVPPSEDSPVKEKLMSPSLEKIVHDSGSDGYGKPAPIHKSPSGREIIELSEDELDEVGPSPYKVLVQSSGVIKLGQSDDGFESWMYQSRDKTLQPSSVSTADHNDPLLVKLQAPQEHVTQTPKEKVTTKVISVTIDPSNLEPYVQKETAVSPRPPVSPSWSRREKARMRITDEQPEPVPQMVHAPLVESSSAHFQQVGVACSKFQEICCGKISIFYCANYKLFIISHRLISRELKPNYRTENIKACFYNYHLYCEKLFLFNFIFSYSNYLNTSLLKQSYHISKFL